MTTSPVLAVSGSNVTGDAPFSAALSFGDRIVGAASPAGARGDLALLVADLCEREGLRPDAVRTICIDVGPGSYTGLRVAVTFVRSLLHFAGVQVHSTDSLSLLATKAVANVAPGRRIRPLLDARRDRVHTAALRVGAGGLLELVEAPRAVPFAEVVTTVQRDDVFVVPATTPPAFAASLRTAGVEVVDARGVTAQDLFAPSLRLVPSSFADLEPRYLMGSYAE